ncbi:MAG: hypothetical protein KDA96_20875, partial [Planctomycetaceae bacterium]|nr:hypothetical protein [Planctomycetaceae bacterium]
MQTFTASSLRVLSVIPPMTQMNTPYPSTAYLTGFLRSQGVICAQKDLAIELVLKLLSRSGLYAIRDAIDRRNIRKPSKSIRHFRDHFDDSVAVIDHVIAFLQGTDPTLAHRIASRTLLPEGPRFRAIDVYGATDDAEDDSLGWAFGALGVQDRARHMATLFLSDLADVIRDGIDDRFEFVRYAESLAASQPTFDPLADALAAPHNLVDEFL